MNNSGCSVSCLLPQRASKQNKEALGRMQRGLVLGAGQEGAVCLWFEAEVICDLFPKKG